MPTPSIPARLFSEAIFFVPTAFLGRILDDRAREFSSDEAHKLCEALSPHKITRSSAGFQYELRVHCYLNSDPRQAPPLPFFNSPTRAPLTPSSSLLAGTFARLDNVADLASFYWLPTATDFTGIDGVLTNQTDVYAIQATIADERKNPADGVKRLWESFDRQVRDHRCWHVVVICNDDKTARKHVEEFTSTMASFTLGREKIPVDVLGCVFE